MEVHERLKSLHALGNGVHDALLRTLRELYEHSLCLELGYSSYHQYCDSELGLPKSTAYEYLRVAVAFDSLAQLHRRFQSGHLSWTQVRSISRVASAATEDQWIDLAKAEPVGSLLVEVQEAQRTGRDAPRKDRMGLPNLMVDIIVRVTLEQKARIQAAFSLVDEGLDEIADSEEAQEQCGGSGSTGQQLPLVRWADAVLAGLIPVSPRGPLRSGSADDRMPTPAQTIVYHTCPNCRRSTVQTPNGALQVSAERIDTLAPVARRVEAPDDATERARPLPDGQRDKPNSPSLSHLVRHRDGLVCANPACGRRTNLHAHHIVFRARGGRTTMSNELTVCGTCHALIHAGLLEVSGNVDEGLTWTPHTHDPAYRRTEANAVHQELKSMAKTFPDLLAETGAEADEEVLSEEGKGCGEDAPG